jgi:hypothetical protein
MINVKTKSQTNLAAQEVRERTKFRVLSRVPEGSTGLITLDVPKPGKISADGREIERAEVVAHRAGRVTFQVRLEPAARVAIKDYRRIRVHIRLSYEPQDGYPITKTVPLIFGYKQKR